MYGSNALEPGSVDSSDKKCAPNTRDDRFLSEWWSKSWDSFEKFQEFVQSVLCQETNSIKNKLTIEHIDIEQHNTVMDIISAYPVVKSFLAGSLSGTVSTIIFQPLDLVKTRLQNPLPLSLGPTSHANGMLTIMGNIVQKEHLFGLWKGMTPSLTRCVPGVGLYFMSVDLLKKNLMCEEPGPMQAVAIGMMARTLSGVCLIPVTVVKTRFESGVYQYRGVSDALRIIYRTEGLKGLSCGLLPTLMRDAPFSGLYLMFYTQIKKMTPREWLNSDLSAPLHFSCGVTAGILASLVTQPADVLKTKMQLYPKKFHGISSVVLYVYNKYGVYGYFKGLVPRMLRRTLMAAMAWTVYEQLTRSAGLK